MNKFDVGEKVKVVGCQYIGDVIITNIQASADRSGLKYKLIQYFYLPIPPFDIAEHDLGWLNEHELIKIQPKKELKQ